MSGMVFVTLLCCRLLSYVADYGGVNVFHVCLNFGIVYDVGVCVKVCGVVCVVVCCLFLTSRCCLLCCDVEGVWGVVIFVLSVMRVVGINLCVVCRCCAPSCYSECVVCA